MKKKYHLKKEIKMGLIGLGGLIIVIVAIALIIKSSNYKKSNEYKLLNVGYTESEINIIKDKLNNKQIEELLNNEHNSSLIKIINSKYFIKSNYERYISYRKINYQNPIEETIALVNTNRDIEYYEKIKETDLSKEELMLVNKYYKLSDEYTPKDLTNISLSYAYSDNKLAKVANEAFVKMVDAAAKENIKLIASSSYRTNQKQVSIYEGLVIQKNSKYADQVSARPGHSEHQTGYALDISTTKAFDEFKETEEYTWLINNSYKYGFILRYPEGKENITGFSYEPWHFRYVGITAATKIYNENITFDEYYAYYIEK